MAEPACFVQATAVAIAGRAVLIHGPSGSGKSDLALRLIDQGAVLVGDDGVMVSACDGRLMAIALPTGAGAMHVAGLGRIKMTTVGAAMPIALAVDLTPVPLDQARWASVGQFQPVAGWSVPQVTIDARQSSAPIKVALALERWGH